MSAATTVFGTYELLEHIIACLPPRNIRRAGNVARFWRQLIQRSKHIRQACCIVPDPDPQITKYDHHKPSGLLTYSPSCTVDLHPVLNGGRQIANDIGVLLDFEIPKTLEAFAGRGSEYATEPPCSVVYLYLNRSDYCRDEIACMVQVREGVKLSDLVVAADEFMESNRRYDAGVLKLGLDLSGASCRSCGEMERATVGIMRVLRATYEPPQKIWVLSVTKAAQTPSAHFAERWT